jgi:hypothetical protein
MSEENKPLLSDDEVSRLGTLHVDLYHGEAMRAQVDISRDQIIPRGWSYMDGINKARYIYEEQLTKDRELIQTLVGELIQSRASILGWIPDELTPMAHQMKIALKRINSALTLAGEHGYQPTEK